jgi:hypothetical protein
MLAACFPASGAPPASWTAPRQNGVMDYVASE